MTCRHLKSRREYRHKELVLTLRHKDVARNDRTMPPYIGVKYDSVLNLNSIEATIKWIVYNVV